MRNIAWVLALLLVLAACSKRAPQAVPDAEPGVYYWRTSLSLDSAERAFLAQHDIKKIYLRVFDVGVGQSGRPVPVATLSFADALPAGVRVVPVVFMTEECLRADTTALAQRMMRRVMKMVDAEGLPGVSEVQIDCDWTRNSQEAYFAFLRHVRQLLARRGMRLSATIRLHQLAMEPPPVDEGALMVYNTGDATRGGDHNPILDYRDVEPYLRYVADYDLPLCAAYPVFGWQLLFSGQEFKAILRNGNLQDTTLFRRLQGNEYLVLQSRDNPVQSDAGDQSAWMSAGDHVRVWQPSAREVERVARALGEQRPELNRQVIIYHLDNKYLNQYDNQFYETIYHL